ncbi:hypothetical protein ACQP3L_34590, partial [Escherichia coli]
MPIRQYNFKIHSDFQKLLRNVKYLLTTLEIPSYALTNLFKMPKEETALDSP